VTPAAGSVSEMFRARLALLTTDDVPSGWTTEKATDTDDELCDIAMDELLGVDLTGGDPVTLLKRYAPLAVDKAIRGLDGS
jgi:hypothetical protein